MRKAEILTHLVYLHDEHGRRLDNTAISISDSPIEILEERPDGTYFVAGPSATTGEIVRGWVNFQVNGGRVKPIEE